MIIIFILPEEAYMSKRCDVTGAQPSFGNAVSHSHRRTRRRWDPNLQQHRFWLPGERRWIKLSLTAKALRTVDRQGIDRVVAGMRARGVRV
jgi:large subunit ribosomal protein L28